MVCRNQSRADAAKEEIVERSKNQVSIEAGRSRPPCTRDNTSSLHCVSVAKHPGTLDKLLPLYHVTPYSQHAALKPAHNPLHAVIRARGSKFKERRSKEVVFPQRGAVVLQGEGVFVVYTFHLTAEKHSLFLILDLISCKKKY